MSDHFKPTDDLRYARECYEGGDNLGAIASAVIGLLSAVEVVTHKESQEDFLRSQWDECDAACARVLNLANTLDANPHASLKPTAFGELAQRIRDAINGAES